MIKFTHYLCIVFVVHYVSAHESARGSLFSDRKEYPTLIANINSQLAALQASTTANSQVLSASTGTIANLNSQLTQAIAAANAASNITAATTTKLNNFINTVVTNEQAVLMAIIADPALATLAPAAQAFITALNAFK